MRLLRLQIHRRNFDPSAFNSYQATGAHLPLSGDLQLCEAAAIWGMEVVGRSSFFPGLATGLFFALTTDARRCALAETQAGLARRPTCSSLQCGAAL